MKKAVMFFLMVFFMAANIHAADDVRALEKRIDELEKKTDELEKELRLEHKPFREAIMEHITSLEKELEMVDYRTARIKALQERIDAFGIGGGLSLFAQGIAKNADGFVEKADASYSADLFIIAPVGPYGNLYFRGDIGQGDGITPYLPPMFSGPNADLEFNQPFFELVEAWYWTSFPYPDVKDQRLELTVGKMSPTAQFDANAVANSETDQFIADIFVNNLAADFSGYGPGLSLAYRFTSIYNKGLNVTGRVGAFEADGDFKDVFDRPFAIAELDIWRPYYGLNGNYRFYGWVNGADHTDFAPTPDDELSNKGFGISIDHDVSTDMTAFLRFGIQDGDVSEFDRTLSFGAQIEGNKWRRSSDVIAVAYGGSHVSDGYADTLTNASSYEHYVEAYYKYWVNKNLTLAPDIQYIINPGGDKDMEDVFIYGLRTQVMF